MFGFGRLATYDYFAHVARALVKRFADAGKPLEPHVVDVSPTASIRRRAVRLAELVAKTADDGAGTIHLLGHSTGGLDARLVSSPSARLPTAKENLAWLSRLRSVTTMSTPHYGTPLAGYFTTAAGTRMLYLLSLFTVTTLSLGRVPLSLFAGIMDHVGGLERRLGIEIKPLDELLAQVLRFVSPAGRAEIDAYLRRVRGDQAGIVQLMPEVMELFNSAVHDHPAVRYGCVATAAPAPGPRSLLSTLGSPLSAAQLAIYTTVYGVASHAAERYPYATPTVQQAELLARSWPAGVHPSSVDGIVPTLSMLWGELLYCGAADHLDVVGHFDDGSEPRTHVDWLRSGARFDRPSFGAMADALCGFMLRG